MSLVWCSRFQIVICLKYQLHLHLRFIHVVLSLVPPTSHYFVAFGSKVSIHITRIEHPYYPPPTKLREGNVFRSGCHSVHRGEGSPPNGRPSWKETHWQNPPPHPRPRPREQRPPRQRPPGMTSSGRPHLKRAVCIQLECTRFRLWFTPLPKKVSIKEVLPIIKLQQSPNLIYVEWKLGQM